MKKSLLFLVCLLTLSVVFAGGEKEDKTTGPEVIQYYTWEDSAHKPLVDEFNRTHDDIYVDAHILPSSDYETKLTTLLAGQADIDCFMEKRQADMFPQYDNGYIEPLDDYFKKTGYSTAAVDAYKEQVTYDGNIIGIPWRGGSYYTYYNRKLFEEAGVPTPDYWVERGEWTWDKFAETAKAITDAKPGNVGACIYIWGNQALFKASQNHEDIISLDGKIEIGDSFFEQLQMRKELEEYGALVPLTYLKVTKTHYSKVFYDGNCGMLLIGEWFPGQMTTGDRDGMLKGFTSADYGITRLPCDNPTYTTQGASTNNHVTSYSKHKDAAFEFISWMGGPEAAAVAASYGVLPAVATDEVRAILSESIPDEKSLDYFLEDKDIFTANFTPYGSRVESMITEFQEEYLLGKVTPEDAPAKFKGELQNIIDTTY